MRRMYALYLGVLPFLALAVLLGLPALEGRARADDDTKLTYSETGYVTVDPARVARPNDERLVLALYDCLTVIDPVSGAAKPAAAERFQEAPDGLSWTFHLRADGRWSDGSPVVAGDFVGAWKRVLDPYEESSWASLLRPLAGCAALLDGDRAMRAFGAARKALRALADEHADGIPGNSIGGLVARTGLAELAAHVDNADLKRLLRWGTDPYPADKARAVADVLKKERRAFKSRVNDAMDGFGKTVGVRSDSDHTLTVLLEARCPWLPQLVARAPFAPLHPSTRGGTQAAFEPSDFLGNGAYHLRGRGAKPRPGVPQPDSVVHLARSPSYRGAWPGACAEILCYTDQGAEEDLRRLKAGDLSWLANPAEGFAETLEKVRGFETRPGGRVVILRLRPDHAPFESRDVRRAFGALLDREAMRKVFWPRADAAARILPPSIAGVGRAPLLPRMSAAEAKKALEKAGAGKRGFPWVVLHYEDRPGVDRLGEGLVEIWEKGLGVEMGLRLERPDEARAVRAAGAYGLALYVLEGNVADPSAYLGTFAPGNAEGGLGTDDPLLLALLEAAGDVERWLERGDEALAAIEAVPGLRARAENARTGGVAARESLRLELWKAVEARLLDEALVIPLLLPKRAHVLQGVSGLGSDAAWRHPAFFGSLRAARR